MYFIIGDPLQHCIQLEIAYLTILFPLEECSGIFNISTYFLREEHGGRFAAGPKAPHPGAVIL
jgi:hypothetical protein